VPRVGVLVAWAFVAVLRHHLYDVDPERWRVVLPTWEACEATRRAVLSTELVGEGAVTAEACWEDRVRLRSIQTPGVGR